MKKEANCYSPLSLCCNSAQAFFFFAALNRNAS